jgi:hypothetical protein
VKTARVRVRKHARTRLWDPYGIGLTRETSETLKMSPSEVQI